jgi:hypothetical protein
VNGIYISPALRRLVIEQAGNRYGYCLVEQELLYGPLELEHLQPRSRRGLTTEDNLWLACRVCNGFKSNQIDCVDPESQQLVPLFNPRREDWWSHFRWSSDGTEIIGTTPTGRATVIALQLNTLEHMKMRRRWVSVGWHPPSRLV